MSARVASRLVPDAAGYYLNQVAAHCALGANIDEIGEALFAARVSPLRPCDRYTPGRQLPLGIVDTLPEIADTRNNALLASAIEPLRPTVERLRQRYGAARIGVIIGSSTSGIGEGEVAVEHFRRKGQLPPAYHYRQQEIGAPSRYVAEALGLAGPAWTISSACTSGAKALASAARLLESGACDAVVAGGADSLCRLTVEGFSALQAVSPAVCQPFSANRSGINVGEAAALFIVSREPSTVRLAGCGETSDAYHISAPHPQGVGAEAAMRAALTGASRSPGDMEYINLHGTATEQNDFMESHAVHRLFGSDVACSSTKPLTGHTLGAAGALEAAFCWLVLQRDDGTLPPHLWDAVRDAQLAPMNGLGVRSIAAPVRTVMSNSFAFGGNNISLILERCDGD